MDAPIFPDKAHPPTDDDLVNALGRAMPHWDRLVSTAIDVAPDVLPEWKFYMKRLGWTFVLRGKKRNLLYMRPTGKARFVVGFVFNEKAVQAAVKSSLPAALITEIKNGPKYPEGRPACLEVTSAATRKTAEQLLAIKLGAY